MRPELDDITLDDVKVNGETIVEKDIILEGGEEEEQEETVVETPDVPETVETPDAVKAPEEPEPPKEEVFPSDRFEGKYNSWDEVKQALEAPKVEFKDEFIKSIVDKYNQDGSLEDFFRAYSVDYDKLSDQDVLKKKFFNDNADIEDEKTIERLWKKELSKYTLDQDEYDQEEVETGLALLKRDAKKVRETLKEDQKKYLQPSQKESAPDENAKIEALKKFVDTDPVVQSIKQSKIVSLDIDGEKYNFELENPEIIAESLVNENLFYNQFIKEGKPDTAKWAEVMAYVTNPQKFRKSLVDFGRSQERKAMEEELKNTRLPTQGKASETSTGDDREDLLNTFAAKGKIVKR